MSLKNKKNIDFKYNFKLFFKLVKPYSWSFIAVILFILILEATKILERYILKVLIDEGTLFSKGLAVDFEKTLLILGLIFAGIFIFRPLFHFLRVHVLNRFEVKLMQDVKSKFYKHLIHLSHRFHVTNKTGSLISRMLRGSHAVEGIVDAIAFNFAPLIIQMTLAGIVLISLHWISAVVILVMSIAFLTFSLIMETKMNKMRMVVIKTEDTEKAAVADTFTNIDSIKYFGKEIFMIGKYFNLTTKSRDSQLKQWDFYRIIAVGQDVILGLGLFFLLFFPIRDFLAGTLSIGEVVFVYTMFSSVANPLYGFIHGIRGLYRSMADFQSLTAYKKIDQEVKDKKSAKKFKVKKGKIEFKDVVFAYDNKKLFNKFNLKIKSSEKIALVGHSGCGKSSLVKLLYRLYDVDGGSISIDGVDLRDMKQETLRSELSIVPQEGVLFDDTILDNIKFAKPNATKKEVIKAMKFAQLYHLVQGFPLKDKTIVGERGVKLSGGEKQRVSIARAILADKKILILDEATSALDSQTEHDIQQDLEKLMKGRTAIIIAHRLSTIMKADRILVMSKGKIVQMGTHNQLIKQKGKYRQLWTLQKGGYL